MTPTGNKLSWHLNHKPEINQCENQKFHEDDEDNESIMLYLPVRDLERQI